MPMVIAATFAEPEQGGQESGNNIRSRDSMIPGATGNALPHTRPTTIPGTNIGNIHMHRVRCPTCGSTKRIKGKQLITSKGWGSITCQQTSCRNKTKAHKWKCSCGQDWTNCGHHNTDEQHTHSNITNATQQITANQTPPHKPPVHIYPNKRKSQPQDDSPQTIPTTTHQRRRTHTTGTYLHILNNLREAVIVETGGRKRKKDGDDEDFNKKPPPFQEPRECAQINAILAPEGAQLSGTSEVISRERGNDNNETTDARTNDVVLKSSPWWFRVLSIPHNLLA